MDSKGRRGFINITLFNKHILFYNKKMKLVILEKELLWLCVIFADICLLCISIIYSVPSTDDFTMAIEIHM